MLVSRASFLRDAADFLAFLGVVFAGRFKPRETAFDDCREGTPLRGRKYERWVEAKVAHRACRTDCVP
jgi:hypothetical protein